MDQVPPGGRLGVTRRGELGTVGRGPPSLAPPSPTPGYMDTLQVVGPVPRSSVGRLAGRASSDVLPTLVPSVEVVTTALVVAGLQ